MWKYITHKQCMKFLLSLNLIDNKLIENSDLDKIKSLYSISNNIENNYRVFKVKKHNGGFRTICEPNSTLKHIQRQILKNILNNKSTSKYAKAYKKGISLKDNAYPHLNKKMILKLDIKDFFDSIHFLDIYTSCFSLEYFPKSIGMLLTYLCTYNNHLPQGSPTSSYISNLVMKEFDEEIGAYCIEQGISYTRYSDDMTFSGDFLPKTLIKKVQSMLSKHGMVLNYKKIHVISRNYRQSVTGIVVNEKMQVSREYRKKIRQEVYFINKLGLKQHLKNIEYNESKRNYLKTLHGKILYVLQINNKDEEFLNYRKYIERLLANNYS